MLFMPSFWFCDSSVHLDTNLLHSLKSPLRSSEKAFVASLSGYGLTFFTYSAELYFQFCLTGIMLFWINGLSVIRHDLHIELARWQLGKPLLCKQQDCRSVSRIHLKSPGFQNGLAVLRPQRKKQMGQSSLHSDARIGEVA